MNFAHVGEPLPEFLVRCISKYRDMYPRMSDNQLAKRINLPASSFGRLINGEVARPSFENSIAVIKEVCPPEDTHEHIKTYFPEVSSTFSKLYNEVQQAPNAHDEVEELFKSPYTYELMMKATTENGIQIDDVRKEFGDRGLAVIDKLETLELLKIDGDRYFYDGNLNATQSTVQELMLNLVQNSYDIKNFGKARNMLTLQYESVDKNVVLPKLRKVIDNCRQEVRELIKDPKNAGKDVVWFAIASDTLGGQQ